MGKTCIAYGCILTLVFAVTGAESQEVTGLPMAEAPFAQQGPFEVLSEPAFGLAGHIVFRPASLNAFPDDDTLPVMVWVNGGCASDSSPYSGFLTTIASHGFLVLATTPVDGAGTPSTTGDLAPPGYDRFTSPFRAALDWAEAETVRQGSSLEGKVATNRMAAMGLSCGGGVAVMLGSDPRIGTVGVFNGNPWGAVRLAEDPRSVHIDRLHGPVMLVYGHESVTVTDSAAGFESIGHVPVFYGTRRDVGHFGTFDHAGGGEFANVASNWLKWTLKGNAVAGAMFVGEDCGLCTDPHWIVQAKGLE
jgi:dienelactone hydrolase